MFDTVSSSKLLIPGREFPARGRPAYARVAPCETSEGVGHHAPHDPLGPFIDPAMQAQKERGKAALLFAIWNVESQVCGKKGYYDLYWNVCTSQKHLIAKEPL